MISTLLNFPGNNPNEEEIELIDLVEDDEIEILEIWRSNSPEY